MFKVEVTQRSGGEHEGTDDARWEMLVDEFRGGVEALMRQNIQAATGMTVTKKEYEADTRFEPIEDGVKIIVGKKGEFSLGQALEGGQRPWHEGPAFMKGKGNERPDRSNRGPTVFRTLVRDGKKKIIPIDSGYANHGGGAWDHPGLPKLSLLKLTKDQAKKVLAPQLYAKFYGGGS